MSQLGQQLKPLFTFLDTLLGKDLRHFDFLPYGRNNLKIDLGP
jgi:hypothetical protein